MHASYTTIGERIIGGILLLMVLERLSASHCVVTPYTFEAYNFGGHCRQNITTVICNGWCESSEVSPCLLINQNMEIRKKNYQNLCTYMAYMHSN